jgi:Sap, sulfolipid-1-addressing protein
VNTAFVGLALLSALNAKLLGVDLLLMGNRRRIVLFVGFLLGGMGVALAIGLLDVLVLHADALGVQGTISAGLDLALGVALLVIGVLAATGRLPGRRGESARSSRDPGRPRVGRAERILSEPRYGQVMLIGAVCGIPGAKYLAALHNLITGEEPTSNQVVSVVVFVVLEFSLVIVPLQFLAVRPEGTEQRIRRSHNWLTSHSRELVAAILLTIGAYLAISGLTRLTG